MGNDNESHMHANQQKNITGHAMTDRSAVDTIRGYFYQFDLSILSILRLTSPSDTVEIECIEDVDIRTATELTAMTCPGIFGPAEI